MSKDPTNVDLGIFCKVVDSDSKSHYKKAYYPAENNSIISSENLPKLESFSCGPESSYFVINSKLFVSGKGNLGVGATNIISSEYLQETGFTPFILYSLFVHF